MRARMISKLAAKSMDSILNKKIFYFLGAFLALEVVSLLVFFYPAGQGIVFLLLSLAALVLAFYRLEYGLLLLVAELIIASKGYLFSAGPLSWRLAIFLSVFLAWLYQSLRRKRFWADLKIWPARSWFWLLFLFIAIGLINGCYHNGFGFNLWSDFNAWLFFALLPAVAAVYYRNPDQKVYQRLAQVALAAVIWLSLKTLIFFFIFAHDFSWSFSLYRWIRTTGVGEITNIGFNWPRIFLQSQVYAPLAFISVYFFPSRRRKIDYLLLTLFLMVTLISFSRSFWVGLAVAAFLSLVLIARRDSMRLALKKFLASIVALLGSLLLIYGLAFWPWPSSLVSFSPDIFQRRANFLNEEAAIASRWSLLSPLWQKIRTVPLLGQGFGTAITYKSSDPRILKDHPDGSYTTYAFEWGYLDLWLKLGLFGLLAYLVLVGRLVGQGLRSKSILALAFAAGLVFLAVTNIFTPYLNHPLGIAYLLLSSCLIF